jgi:hypothetical protein
MQYPPLAPMQNQAAFQNMVQPVNQGNSMRGANSELSPNSVPRSFNSASLGSPYSPLPSMQYPGAYPGGPINNRPFGNSHNSVRVANSNAHSPTSSSASSNPGPQREGLSSRIIFEPLNFFAYRKHFRFVSRGSILSLCLNLSHLQVLLEPTCLYITSHKNSVIMIWQMHFKVLVGY